MEDISNIAFCPNCCNTAPQKLVHVHKYQESSYDVSSGELDPEGPVSSDFVAICSTCNELLLYYSFNSDHNPENFSKAVLVHPKKLDLHKSIPKKVRDAYLEALRIQKHAPNAFVVMIRRSLEALCDDRGVKERSLFKMLEELVKRGEIPETLAEMTTVLRLIGNAGAHHTDVKVIVPMTWAMDEFFRAVVEYVYVAPSKLADFKEKLDKASPGGSV